MAGFSTIVFLSLLHCITAHLDSRADHRIYFKRDPFNKNFVFSNGCNFYGSYLTWYRTAEEDCSSKCEDYGSECSHYVWVREERVCYLRTGRIGFEDAFPVGWSESSCGIHCDRVRSHECREALYIKPHIPKFFNGPPAKVVHAQGCFFNEHSLQSFYNATLELCTNECRNVAHCTHFNFKEGFCYMMSGHAISDDMIMTKDDSHCGFDCQSMDNDICRMFDGGNYNSYNPGFVIAKNGNGSF